MKEHGRFTLDIEGRILNVSVIGGWNLDTSHHYVKEVLELGQTLAGQPWAILADLRRWELGPPEIIKLTHQLAASLDHLDRTHTALISSEHVLIQQIVQEARLSAPSTSQAAFFDDESQALAWLREAGFDQ